MMNLGSEGVYLDEKCRTNPSRYLPGPKTPIKNQKMPILGFRGLGFRVYGLGGPAAGGEALRIRRTSSEVAGRAR